MLLLGRLQERGTIGGGQQLAQFATNGQLQDRLLLGRVGRRRFQRRRLLECV